MATRRPPPVVRPPTAAIAADTAGGAGGPAGGRGGGRLPGTGGAGTGGGDITNYVNIYITGGGDPNVIADIVYRGLQTLDKRGTIDDSVLLNAG